MLSIVDIIIFKKKTIMTKLFLLFILWPSFLFSQETVLDLKNSLPEIKLPFYFSEMLPLNNYKEKELDRTYYPYLIEDITRFIDNTPTNGIEKRYFGVGQISFNDWFGVFAAEELKNQIDSTAFYKLKLLTFSLDGTQIGELDFMFSKTIYSTKDGFNFGIETNVESEISECQGEIYVSQETKQEILRFETYSIFEDEPPMTETQFLKSKQVTSVFVIEKNGVINEGWPE